MSDLHPLADEDAFAEVLADAAIRMVEASHPHGDRATRRRLARLYLRQLTGSEKPPGEISEAAVAKALGIPRQRANEAKQSGLIKLWHALQTAHPELFP